MSRSKTRRQPTTEPTREQAAVMFAAEGQLEAVRRAYFCEPQWNIPIAGTERPLPCPFCGKADDISLVLDNVLDAKTPYVRAHVECGVCGAEAPCATTLEDDIADAYSCALKAARRWNTRGGESS